MPSLELSPMIVAGLAAAAIFVIAIGIAMSGRSGISDRLERYASARPQAGAAGAGGQGGVADLIAQSQALASLNKAVEARDFWANIARDIARADLHLKPSEFLSIWVGSIVGTPLIMVFLSAFLPALRNPLFLLVGIVVGFFLPRFWLKQKIKRNQQALNMALPDALD